MTCGFTVGFVEHAANVDREKLLAEIQRMKLAERGKVRMPFWAALAIIPGGWLVNYAIGMWAQAHGIGWF